MMETDQRKDERDASPRYYWKRFIIPLIIGVVAIGLACLYVYRSPAGVIAGLLAAISAGATMFWILSTMHIESVKKISSEVTEETLDVYQKRDVELSLPYDQAFDLCKESLGHITKSRINKEDRATGRINARTVMQWKTWGDDVAFELSRIDDGHTRVKISSRPALRTTMFDYGKSLENVLTILNFLGEIGKTSETNHETTDHKT